MISYVVWQNSKQPSELPVKPSYFVGKIQTDNEYSARCAPERFRRSIRQLRQGKAQICSKRASRAGKDSAARTKIQNMVI